MINFHNKIKRRDRRNMGVYTRGRGYRRVLKDFHHSERVKENNYIKQYESGLITESELVSKINIKNRHSCLWNWW